MGNITTYLETKLVGHSVGKASYTMPTTVYAGLFISSPTAAYTSASPDGVEVGSIDHGYARLPISWNSASSGSITNSSALVWTATGYWNSATGASVSAEVKTIGIFDSLNNSGTNNLLWFGPLSAGVTLENGDSFTIEASNLVLTLS